MPILLSEFLGELRDVSGFEAGDEQYIAALTLLETMASRGEVPSSAEGWITLLGPVLCSSPAQQEQFGELYRAWLARLPKTGVAWPSVPKPEPSASKLRARDSSSRLAMLLRRFSRVLAGIALVSLCALAFLVYRHTHRPPPPLPKTVSEGTPRSTTPNMSTDCTTASCAVPAQTGLQVRRPSGKAAAGAAVYYGGHSDSTTDKSGSIALDLRDAPGSQYALVISDDSLPQVVRLRGANQLVELRPLSGTAALPWAVSLFVLLLAAALAGWWLVHIWQRRLELKKWAVPLSEERDLGVAVGGRGAYRSAGIRALATSLRRRRPEESVDLDAAATVERTAGHAGYFTPVFARRTSEPDYLFVGERKNLRDQQARMHDELVTRLRDHDVQMQRYYFQSDPRICVDSKGVSSSLLELAAIFRDHEVWLAMDAGRCLDARTHRPHKWWPVVERWHDRLLLTQTPPDFNLEIAATRPTRAGLAEFLESGPTARGAIEGFPSVLRGAAGEWLDSSEPPPALMTRMIAQLQMYLGPAGYVLLQACAVYPAMTWNITVTLAGELLAEADVEQALERLVELPWFRHGTMPDWLRVRLVSRLGTREAAVRAALLRYLDSAYSSSLNNAERLDILPGTPKLKARPGPLEDHVYLSFVRGQLSDLSVEAPSRWRRLVRTAHLPGPWAVTGAFWALSFFTGWVLGPLTDKHLLSLKPGSYAYLLYEVSLAQEQGVDFYGGTAKIAANSAIVADLMHGADPARLNGSRLVIDGATIISTPEQVPTPGMVAMSTVFANGGADPDGHAELIKSVNGERLQFFGWDTPAEMLRTKEKLDLSNVTPRLQAKPPSPTAKSTPPAVHPPHSSPPRLDLQAEPESRPLSNVKARQIPQSLATLNAGTRTPIVDGGGAPPMNVNESAMATSVNGSPRPTSLPLSVTTSANRSPVAADAPAAASMSQVKSASPANEASSRVPVDSRKVLSSDGKLVAEDKVAFAQMAAGTGSEVVASDAQAAVEFHNAKRNDVGSPPLSWSPELAGVAQQWADHLASLGCNLQSTPNNKHGENLFAGAGKSLTALDASQSWYSEIQKYRYGPLDPNNWAPTGHYTQMVWKTTTQMGMGRATCPNGVIVIVAEYNPPGNYMEQKPY